ncbi:hypothetical protein [Streptomyces litchfieldiae]|uniref:Uncharacterized protein n=1 Tax=Streptomyces litchfieldiae TaxID=3075543 RepID=A0ABU2MIY4_9ACTN|nr:hypothetical protein [Streptomyces sp. DSM 44938]MDT0341485.1 hypothetical protein [Streptomyces sp. DSM 44938]
MLGTLLGAVVTHTFQRAAARRSESFAAGQQLRAERMGVYSEFAGAVTEFRRGQQDRWHRRHEDPDGTVAFDARVESYRLRGVALQTLFRVRLVASGQPLTDAAERAYELTGAVHRAADHVELKVAAQQAREALEEFIAIAASDIR